MDKKKAASLSIYSNSLLIIVKLIAGLMMHSVGVISEAIHSSIDLIASFIAFLSIRISVKPPDEDHPYGHGKYEDISGFVEALLIFSAALLIIYAAVQKIISGAYVKNLDAGIVVMFFASIVNGVISYILFRVAKRTESIALRADAMHLLTDVFTSLGVAIGLIAIKITKIDILDPIIAIFVAVIIIKTSISLTHEAIKELSDSSLPEEEVEKIINIINSNPEVTSFHKLRTRKVGAKREIDIHLRINKDYNIVDAHNLSHKIQNQIREEFPYAYVMIHLEPESKTKE